MKTYISSRLISTQYQEDDESSPWAGDLHDGLVNRVLDEDLGIALEPVLVVPLPQFAFVATDLDLGLRKVVKELPIYVDFEAFLLRLCRSWRR